MYTTDPCVKEMKHKSVVWELKTDNLEWRFESPTGIAEDTEYQDMHLEMQMQLTTA